MEEKISIIKLLGLPEAFVVVVLTFSLVLVLAPYFSGADFGLFKIPQFTENARKKLKIFGPIIFITLVTSMVPMIPKVPSSANKNENSNQANTNNTEVQNKNGTIPPTAEPLPNREQDTANKQPRNEKPSNSSQALEIKPKKEVSDNAPTYEVRLVVSSDLKGAEIFIDGKPVVGERLPNFIIVRVERKNQPTKILLRTPEKSCHRTLLINSDLKDLVLCD